MEETRLIRKYSQNNHMRENLYELNNTIEYYAMSIDRETYGQNQQLVEQEDFFQNKDVILNSPVNKHGFLKCCKTVEIISKHLEIALISSSYSIVFWFLQ